MPSRVQVGVPIGFVMVVLLGCKEGSDAGRPLPAPEPPASSAKTPSLDELAAPKKRPSLDDVARAVSKRPSGEAAPKPAVSAASDAGAASGGAAASTTAEPSAAPVGVTTAECSGRCTNALQGCLSQPVDAGVPGFGNLDLCKKAFEACQAACK